MKPCYTRLLNGWVTYITDQGKSCAVLLWRFRLVKWKSITSPISTIIVCKPSFSCSQSHFKGFLQEFHFPPSFRLIAPILTTVGITEMVFPSKLLLFNSSPIDDCGNWCHQSLEGLPITVKIQGRVGRFPWHPASGHWPAPSQWKNLHIPITNVDFGRVGGKFEKQILVTKAVIHKRSAEQATANLATSKALSMQAHGNASPWGHPAGHENLLRRWLDPLTLDSLSLNYI